MLIIPGINVKEGHCVTLTQSGTTQLFSREPANLFKMYVTEGATTIQIIDLDAILNPKRNNFHFLETVLKIPDTKIFYGGGIESLSTIQTLVDLGVDKVILGTAAIQNESLAEKAIERFGERVMISLNLSGDALFLRKWQQQAPVSPADFLKRMVDVGATQFLIVDLARHNTCSGFNQTLLSAITPIEKHRVFLSGGISSIDEIKKIQQQTAVVGCVIGRALLEGKVNLHDALDCSSQ